MPPAPLGRDALHGMLSAAGRVVIVNTSTPADTISIVAAAIVRHDSTGDARQSLTMLDLEADESEWVDPPSPVSEPPTMVEVLLRMSRNGSASSNTRSANRPVLTFPTRSDQPNARAASDVAPRSA